MRDEDLVTTRNRRTYASALRSSTGCQDYDPVQRAVASFSRTKVMSFPSNGMST
jgi:hypothetical protein